MTFDEELQNLLNSHPEVVEVKVKYRKDTVFKRNVAQGILIPNDLARAIGVPSFGDRPSTEVAKASEMIKNGEL